jgi:hypothetical protein
MVSMKIIPTIRSAALSTHPPSSFGRRLPRPRCPRGSRHRLQVQRVGASAVVSLQRAPAPSAACLGRQGGRSRTIAETRGIKLQAKAARVALLPLIQNGRPCDLGTGRLRGHRPGDGGGWPEARRTRQQRVGMKFNLTAIVSRSKPSPIPETTSGPRRTRPLRRTERLQISTQLL